MQRKFCICSVLIILLFSQLVYFLYNSSRKNAYGTTTDTLLLKRTKKKLKEILLKVNEHSINKSIIETKLNSTIITLVNSSTSFLQVKSFIGSIHLYHPEASIIIYSLNFTKKIEMNFWKGVDFIDVLEMFMMAKRDTITNFDIEMWKPVIIKYATELYGNTLYIDSNLIIRNSLHDIDNTIQRDGVYSAGEDSTCLSKQYIQGFSLNSLPFSNYLVPLTQCVRKKCTTKELKQVHDGKLLKCKQLEFKKTPHDTNNTCNIQLRNDNQILFNDYTKSENKIALALVLNSGNNSEYQLFHSLMSTISLKECSNCILYLGFNNQEFTDISSLESFKHTIMTLMNPVPVKFIQGVKIETILWNLLFQHALKEGADYFVKLDEHSRFIDHLWLTKMLKKFQERNNFGVITPLEKSTMKPSTRTFLLNAKSHNQIFGSLLPYINGPFHNQWITSIYSPNFIDHATIIDVLNTREEEECQLSVDAIEQARQTIKNYR